MENDIIFSFTIVPNSQVIISRVAYLNNSSKYFINNKASNASEVTTLLKKRGIDLDNNRFLILQGEVEQISLMRRDYLSIWRILLEVPNMCHLLKPRKLKLKS